MSLLSRLRTLRHGPLSFLSPLWVPLGRLYRWAVAKSGRGFVSSHRIGPYGPFRMTGAFAFSDFDHWGGGHNRGFAFCVEASRGKSCVLDVGAHIGLVTLPVSRAVAAHGRVIAFEPSDANAATLREHLRLNAIDNVEIVDALVGDKVLEAVEFFEHSGVSGMNSRAPVKSDGSYTETRHPQTTLDAFCAANRLKPEVVKIDVEGAEFAVLEGAREILSSAHPIVVVSIHPTHLRVLGREPEELHDLAAALGYTVTDIDGRPVDVFRLDEYVLTPND
jgi:FkbM family methyltransferase